MATTFATTKDSNLNEATTDMILRDPATSASASSASKDRSLAIIEDSDINGIDPPIHNSTLRRCKLHNVRIFNSTLVDCVVTGAFAILTDCSIFGSTLTDAKLHDCFLSKDTSVCTSILAHCSARNSTFIACNTDLTVIKRCCVQDGTITPPGAENPDAVGVAGHCVVKNSLLNVCNFFKTDCANSTLHQATRISEASMKCCKVTNSPLALRRFPPEIRRLIFEHALTWDGHTCPLIKVLRGDEELHFEALELQYSNFVFNINFRNYDDHRLISQHAINSVKSLTIEPMFFPALTKFALEASKLTEIRVFDMLLMADVNGLWEILRKTKEANYFQRLVLELDLIKVLDGVDDSDIIDSINSGLNVQGLL